MQGEIDMSNQNNNNANMKKLLIIAVSAIAVLIVAFSIKVPEQSSNSNAEVNGNNAETNNTTQAGNGNETDSSIEADYSVEENYSADESNGVEIENATETINRAEAVKDSDIVIPISDITEIARFYPAEINDTELEVLAVKAPDGSIRTAFNTCQVCYSSGRGYYIQEEDVLVCQNCGNRFAMDDVEITRGGCNPVPITEEYKTVDEENITVSKDYLAEATTIFANWK